ncbi:MAG TPA: NAD(P)H-dependent glycerol-3-phosphate dehydrogenase [Candidatus Omnitrophota bacterium]|nr:NAD(P)H-dependent glycerol-3-phosphate dehydrogenase [Candidatus Omnitrophota bacterium]HPS37286.1 NAD(P)H-dependent glycerol-3-phosphate dehydrogenase [Candidatus Omnitrophota bacterium]
MSKNIKVTVLGDGGWGTALALVNVRRGNDVMMWSNFPDYVRVLETERENVKFLPGVKLPDVLRITSDLREAVEFGDVIVLSIPAQYLRNILFKLKELPHKNKILISTAKGIEKKTCLRPSEIIRAVFGKDHPIVVLSGPSHAEEVARKIPTLVVAASEDPASAKYVQEHFRDPQFRIYVQKDIIGVEFGGALKNVIAIAAGVCDGLNFGDNTKSGLITRGLYEIVRLGVKYGANPNTFFGLSGIGDLITTCFSKHGRNLFVGRELGKGRTIKEILGGMAMVAEGVDTALSVHQLCSREALQLPIMTEVYKMLFEDKAPSEVVSTLLSRPPYEEWKAFDFTDFADKPDRKK